MVAMELIIVNRADVDEIGSNSSKAVHTLKIPQKKEASKIGMPRTVMKFLVTWRACSERWTPPSATSSNSRSRKRRWSGEE